MPVRFAQQYTPFHCKTLSPYALSLNPGLTIPMQQTMILQETERRQQQQQSSTSSIINAETDASVNLLQMDTSSNMNDKRINDHINHIAE